MMLPKNLAVQTLGVEVLHQLAVVGATLTRREMPTKPARDFGDHGEDPRRKSPRSHSDWRNIAVAARCAPAD